MEIDSTNEDKVRKEPFLNYLWKSLDEFEQVFLVEKQKQLAKEITYNKQRLQQFKNALSAPASVFEEATTTYESMVNMIHGLITFKLVLLIFF